MSEIHPANRRPATDEYFSYYDKYVQQVPPGDLFESLERQIDSVRTLFASVSDSQAQTTQPPYTWTLKQVVGHLIDAERIFAERLHHFASHDLQDLTGMEQEEYVAASDYDSPSLKALVDELLFCRQANLLLVRRVRQEAWDYRGRASGHSVTVRALAYCLVGHIEHHLKIVRQRIASLK